ncbi:uracil-DNA glycosylase [Fusobacterium sp.]|uniref:uracil-DNA glycosylase n=1 Tax=Fusobacterium sp. TaxID=68766 RepID=UPI0025C22EBE|nr:uracil-DNA glycosylase [Fusobacterium sp.]
MITFGNDWDEILKDEFEKEYYKKLRKFLIEEYKTRIIYPKMENIFSALKLTSYEKTKVLILGQDPYHGPNQAHGLAFSVNPGVKIPPSLLNMYKELKSELGLEIPNNGYLIPWSEQGVLLLNTALTVRAGEANSHSGMGWEIFTDNVIKHLNDREDPVIFVLWGNNARKKKSYITNKQHFILEGPHPSPLSASRGFFGCNHFKKINEILENIGKKEIDWQIKNV